MEKIFFILVFLGFNSVNAQNENCTHNVSTNYQNPTNNSTPFNTSLQGDEFLNQFDWNAINSSGFLTTYQLQNMTYNQNMINIQSVASGSYYSYLYSSEKMSFENGWELLLLNIGSFPNLDPLPNSDYADIPYIVLYNRYKGIIRLFANYGNGYLSTNASIDAMRIELKIDDDINGKKTYNGLLRLNEGNDISLDQKTNISAVSATAVHPNVANKWFSCDFQIAYDPCICYFPSSFRINFFSVENVDFELHGREIQIEQNLITGKAINQKDFLSNFNYTGQTADGGMIMYKAIDYLVNDYEVKLDSYRAKLAQVNEFNEQLNRNSFIIKTFKSIVLSGGSSLVSSVLGANWVSGLTNFISEFSYKNFNDSLVIDVEKIKKEAKSALSKEINTFFTENFEKQDLPSAPIAPTATFSEMHFQGKISDNTSLTGPYFFTPGSYGTIGTGSPPLTEFSKYPIYNDALGIFALLEAPKLIKSNHFEVEKINNDELVLSNKMQFKLSEPLKYRFNPALDIKSKKISAMLLFDIKNKNPNLLSLHGNKFKVNDISINLFSESINTYINSLLFDYDTLYDYLIPNYDNFKYIKSDLKYDSGFIPLDAFNNFVIEIGTAEKQSKYEDLASLFFSTPHFQTNNLIEEIWDTTSVKVRLKLLIDIVYNSNHENGDAHEYTYVLTYEIKNSNITLSNLELYPNIKNSVGNINQYKKKITFNNTLFNGNLIEGCQLNGNNYTCKAWEDININGNIDIANGFKVDFIAGNTINVNPEAILSPELTLEIKPILDFSNPMAESNEEFVKNFCQNTSQNSASYQANEGSFKVVAAMEEEKNKKQNELAYNWDFNLYPNPATHSTTVLIDQMANSNFVVQLVDVTGKILFNETNNNQKSTNLDISNFKKGMYFVSVYSNGSSKTKQLVIY